MYLRQTFVTVKLISSLGECRLLSIGSDYKDCCMDAFASSWWGNLGGLSLDLQKIKINNVTCEFTGFHRFSIFLSSIV